VNCFIIVAVYLFHINIQWNLNITNQWKLDSMEDSKMKILKSWLTLVLIVFVSVNLSFAADQTRDRKKDRKKDGSCSSYTIDHKTGMSLAADQTRSRKRDRKKDGSCGSYTIDHKTGMSLAADQTRSRKRDRKKDGSCNNNNPFYTETYILT